MAAEEKKKVIKEATWEEVKKYGSKYTRDISYFLLPPWPIYMLDKLGYIPVLWISSACVIGGCWFLETLIGHSVILSLVTSIAFFVFVAMSVTAILDLVYTRGAIRSLLNDLKTLSSG